MFNSILESNFKRGQDGASSAAMESRPRKRYNDLQLSTLDTIFVSSKGSPPPAVIERTAKALELDSRQVG